jgi:hypothetical protein
MEVGRAPWLRPRPPTAGFAAGFLPGAPPPYDLNLQPDAAACRRQCLLLPACRFGTYFSRQEHSSSSGGGGGGGAGASAVGTRAGQCWLSAVSSAAAEAVPCGAGPLDRPGAPQVSENKSNSRNRGLQTLIVLLLLLPNPCCPQVS